jgi:hypothetical protein
LNKNTKLKDLNLNSHIFNKSIKTNYKLIPFNSTANDIGKVKYFPASSKEWKNSVYYYNYNKIKNFPIYDLNINKIIKGYFNMHFNYQFIRTKIKARKWKRASLNRIHVSRPEIKHTNSKAIITVYTYNKEKAALIQKVLLLRKKFLREILYFLLKSKKACSNITEKFYSKIVESLLIKELILLRRYKLRLNLNKYKFEERFLSKLSILISKLYGKHVEFNIVNLKSIVLNSDLFTNILAAKIRKRRINIIRAMNIVLHKAQLPIVNNIIERGTVIKNVDFNLVENKYKDLSLVDKNHLDQILNDLYPEIDTNYNGESKLHNIIFNNIRYKNMGGIRLEIRGRLTRRYRADRAVYKVRWKGGLKNIDSSFKGLSTVNMRGYANSNTQHSMVAAKRRIGAFAVKGWISGK